MRILVFGGGVFLSRAVAAEAVRRGHAVTCASRGESGGPPAGAAHVAVDRRTADALPVEVGDHDAVVDVARHPSWVARALAATPHAHWVFVSTISVYADTSTPGGSPATLALHPARETDADLAVDPDAYGPMKVACEQLVRARGAGAMVIRSGLIAGPGDPTGRFTYWPARMADAGEVLAPGAPTDPMQLIDVRDFAAWIVDSAERRRTGLVDGVGPVMPRGDFLTEVARGVATSPRLAWRDAAFLTAHGVAPWSGADAMPMWLPASHAGLMAHDPAPAVAAGFTARPLADTARDTLAWLRADPTATVTGMSRAREAELLAADQASARSVRQ